MNANDPNVAKVELIAAALGGLCERLILVGGCATGHDGLQGLVSPDESHGAHVETVVNRLRRIAGQLASP